MLKKLKVTVPLIAPSPPVTLALSWTVLLAGTDVTTTGAPLSLAPEWIAVLVLELTCVTVSGSQGLVLPVWLVSPL